MASRIFSFCMLLLMGSCGLSNEEMKLLAIEEFERKVTLLKQDQAQLCFKAALQIAEERSDSIIYSRRINPLGEDLYRPEVPVKPDFVPTDSLLINSKQTVKPIIERQGEER